MLVFVFWMCCWPWYGPPALGFIQDVSEYLRMEYRDPNLKPKQAIRLLLITIVFAPCAIIMLLASIFPMVVMTILGIQAAKKVLDYFLH